MRKALYWLEGKRASDGPQAVLAARRLLHPRRICEGLEMASYTIAAKAWNRSEASGCGETRGEANGRAGAERKGAGIIRDAGPGERRHDGRIWKRARLQRMCRKTDCATS